MHFFFRGAPAVPAVIILLAGLFGGIAASAADDAATPKDLGCQNGSSPFVVLMYHRVTSAGQGSEFSTPARNLERQLKWLAENGYHSILLKNVDEILRGKATPDPKGVLLTFDDAFDSDWTLAAPALERHGFRGVFFVISGRLTAAERARYRALKERGHEIGSHSVSHAYLTKKNCRRKSDCCGSVSGCSAEQVERELRTSAEDLGDLFGEVKAFAWPGNYYDKETIKIARAAGYDVLFACEQQVGAGKAMIGAPGTTSSAEEIFRIEIDGRASLEDFAEAVTKQRPLVISRKKMWRYALPQSHDSCR